MMHTTKTAIAIDTAIRAAGGDFYATKRACGRFCTESLVDAAEQCLASLTRAETQKFASTVTYRKPSRPDRDWALEALCSYVHAVRIREWSAAFEASCAAARAEMPAAIESLCAHV